MRRRRRAPTTQLARAGERTQILIGDAPLAQARFTAQVFDGTPRGRIDLETVHGPRTAELTDDNLLDTDGLISLSVVPEQDTAISFRPIERPSNPLIFVTGAALVLGAAAWTAYEFLGA